jgi:hypothetical protein
VKLGESSRILNPTGFDDIFQTPILLNGQVGGFPDDFILVANVSAHGNGCDGYEARDKIALVYLLGGCSIIDKIHNAIAAGAIGVLLRSTEQRVGRLGRTPVTPNPPNFPAVIIGSIGAKQIEAALNASAEVLMEVVPGRNEWIEDVLGTPWFLTLQLFFILMWAGLLVFIIVKFVRKVKFSGFQWNISFVYLMIQMVFCLVNMVTYVDPLNSRGLFPYSLRVFFGFFPNSWAFTALLLMAFFWFETVSQFSGLKTSAFLTNKVQVPFYVFAGLINCLPIIAAVLTIFVDDSVAGSAAIGVVTGLILLIVAAFYITVGVKVLRAIKRSKQNSQKKRLANLQRLRISIVISCVISTVHPIVVLILNGLSSFTSDYLLVVTLYETTVLLGLITFIQVYFMKTKTINASMTTRINSVSHVVSSNELAKKTTTESGGNDSKNDELQAI